MHVHDVGQCEELEDAVDADAEDTSTATATSSSSSLSSSGHRKSLLRITIAEQWREVDQYNAMVVLGDEDDDDEEDDEGDE